MPTEPRKLLLNVASETQFDESRNAHNTLNRTNVYGTSERVTGAFGSQRDLRPKPLASDNRRQVRHNILIAVSMLVLESL